MRSPPPPRTYSATVNRNMEFGQYTYNTLGNLSSFILPQYPGAVEFGIWNLELPDKILQLQCRIMMIRSTHISYTKCQKDPENNENTSRKNIYHR